MLAHFYKMPNPGGPACCSRLAYIQESHRKKINMAAVNMLKFK